MSEYEHCFAGWVLIHLLALPKYNTTTTWNSMKLICTSCTLSFHFSDDLLSYFYQIVSFQKENNDGGERDEAEGSHEFKFHDEANEEPRQL